MRTLLITALAATVPFGMAMAQPAGQSDSTTVTTTVTPAAPPAPPAILPPSPPQSAPGASASGSADVAATPGPDGVVRQWGPQQEIVETAPPAPQSYPLCSRTVQDSCRNPNPAKELPYYRQKD